MKGSPLRWKPWQSRRNGKCWSNGSEPVRGDKRWGMAFAKGRDDASMTRTGHIHRQDATRGVQKASIPPASVFSWTRQAGQQVSARIEEALGAADWRGRGGREQRWGGNQEGRCHCLQWEGSPWVCNHESEIRQHGAGFSSSPVHRRQRVGGEWDSRPGARSNQANEDKVRERRERFGLNHSHLYNEQNYYKHLYLHGEESTTVSHWSYRNRNSINTSNWQVTQGQRDII